MHLLVALTVADIVFLWLILAVFVALLTAKLQGVANNLGSIDGGVQAISGHTKILHAGADAINSNLNAAARNLTEAVTHAQALGAG
jgi:hypothetical protein